MKNLFIIILIANLCCGCAINPTYKTYTIKGSKAQQELNFFKIYSSKKEFAKSVPNYKKELGSVDFRILYVLCKWQPAVNIIEISSVAENIKLLRRSYENSDKKISFIDYYFDKLCEKEYINKKELIKHKDIIENIKDEIIAD